MSAPDSYTPRHLAEKILTSRSALEGERKQVTVLFADVAGFSSLAERLDPEAIHEVMDGCFAALTQHVHRYEGTINQFTGDGIMALFGAPIAHEDHAVRALHAALDIQTAMQTYGEAVQRQWGEPFQMRVGVNTGLVVVGRIGDDLRMDYTAQGDTVNLAARMQQMAIAGAIWVAEATFRTAAEAFEWQSLGPMAVKGKTAEVGVYELRGRRETRGRLSMVARRSLTQFTGRDVELQQLMAAWRRAQSGHGQVVSVVGEAGLGKSRLLYEFKRHLEQEKARGVEGTCFNYGSSISYLPFLDIVRHVCGLTESDAEAAAKRQIEMHLTALGLESAAVSPYLHNVLSFSVDDQIFPKLTANLVRQRTVNALKTLVMAEARHRALALILEDVHWIDKATEEVVGTVVDAMVDVPLLLVLVYRPEYLHGWAGRPNHASISLGALAQSGGAAMVRAVLNRAYASQVSLAPLPPAERTAMAQALLGGATIPTEFETLIVSKTDGNPLFIEEMTRSLLERGAMTRTPEGYVVTRPVETLDPPATVQGVLLARIDRLPSDLKEILQVAAVIGRVFTHPLLAHVVGRGAALEPMLLELVDLEFIYPTNLAPRGEYSFKHVLTQEAVYGTLLRPPREMCHQRVGEALEVLYPDRLEESYELLAYHYGRSGNKDKAVEYLCLANGKAAKASAMDEAKRHFDEAMALLDTLPATAVNQRRRVSLLVDQGWVMNALLRFPEYHGLLTRYEAMATALGDRRLLGAFHARLAWSEWSFGDFERAAQTAAVAVQQCGEAGNHDDAAQAYVHWQWSHLCTGDYEGVLRLETEILRTLEDHFNLRWYLFAVTAASLAYSWLGRWDEAVAEAEKAFRMGSEFADNSVIAFAAFTLSHAYTAKGDLPQALSYGELAVDKAPTPADKVWSQSFLCWALCRAGQPQRGVDFLVQSVAMQRGARFIWSEVCALWLGEGYWRLGEHDKARQTLEELESTAQRCGMQFLVGSARRLLGELNLLDNPVEAAACFETSITTLGRIKAENELALAYAGYGRLHARQGDTARARDCLTRALAIFERLGTLGEPDRVLQEMAALPVG